MTDLRCPFCKERHHEFRQDEAHVFTCAGCNQGRGHRVHGPVCEPRRFEPIIMSVLTGRPGWLAQVELRQIAAEADFLMDITAVNPPGVEGADPDQSFPLYMSRGDLKRLRDLFDQALKETPE